jgi:hypothetical protein
MTPADSEVRYGETMSTNPALYDVEHPAFHLIRKES